MYLAIRDRIVGTAAGENQRVAASRFVDVIENMEKRFLIHGLNGACDIPVSCFQRLIGAARRAKQILQFLAEESTYGRCFVHPLVDGLAGMMSEITEIQSECAVVAQQHDTPQLIHEPRLAIGRQPHDLVLVSIMRKAKILGYCLIEDTERMGKK